jgi:hypothetical protein
MAAMPGRDSISSLHKQKYNFVRHAQRIKRMRRMWRGLLGKWFDLREIDVDHQIFLLVSALDTS